MNGADISKQRGIYSEILTTEDTENLKVIFVLVIIWIACFDHRTCLIKRNLNER